MTARNKPPLKKTQEKPAGKQKKPCNTLYSSCSECCFGTFFRRRPDIGSGRDHIFFLLNIIEVKCEQFKKCISFPTVSGRSGLILRGAEKPLFFIVLFLLQFIFFICINSRVFSVLCLLFWLLFHFCPFIRPKTLKERFEMIVFLCK